MENIKKQLEEVIKKNLPEKKEAGLYTTSKATGGDIINYNREDNDDKREGFNQALSQIPVSLIADEVLKVVVEKITKDILDEIEQYIVSAKAIKINKQQADFVYWYDIKLAIKRLLSNLSPNKENKNND